MPEKLAKIGRRTLLKSAACGVAASALGRMAYAAVPRTIKIGLVGTKTGGLAVFYEGMPYVIDLIKKEDVMYMSGDGRYTQIYIANGKKILTGRKIGDYEKVLDHGMFFRTHRSFIINMQYVARINKREGFYCEMVNGQTVPISKRKQDEFSRFLRVKD